MMLSPLSRQQPFKNKTIVLTGASGGIGLELSHALAEQGANIIAIAKSQAKLSIWANDLKPFGIKTAIIPFDLSKTDQFFSLTLHSMWKWIIHKVTGRCELLRIQYEEQPGSYRTVKTGMPN